MLGPCCTIVPQEKTAAFEWFKGNPELRLKQLDPLPGCPAGALNAFQPHCVAVLFCAPCGGTYIPYRFICRNWTCNVGKFQWEANKEFWVKIKSLLIQRFWLQQEHKLKGDYSFEVKYSGSEVKLHQFPVCVNFSFMRPRCPYLEWRLWSGIRVACCSSVFIIIILLKGIVCWPRNTVIPICMRLGFVISASESHSLAHWAK